MNYTIQKIENGNIQNIHKHIESREKAKEILKCIANENIKLGFIVINNSCSVIVNSGEIIYIIGE